MSLRRLLALLSIPGLSAACCCGEPPTVPAEELVGTWALDRPMPTGSSLGELDSVRVVFHSLGETGHLLRGRSAASGDTVLAAVRLVSPDPRAVAFSVERTAEEGAFLVHASGPMTGGGELWVTFSGEAGGELGVGVFRRR